MFFRIDFDTHSGFLPLRAEGVPRSGVIYAFVKLYIATTSEMADELAETRRRITYYYYGIWKSVGVLRDTRGIRFGWKHAENDRYTYTFRNYV